MPIHAPQDYDFDAHVEAAAERAEKRLASDMISLSDTGGMWICDLLNCQPTDITSLSAGSVDSDDDSSVMPADARSTPAADRGCSQQLTRSNAEGMHQWHHRQSAETVVRKGAGKDPRSNAGKNIQCVRKWMRIRCLLRAYWGYFLP